MMDINLHLYSPTTKRSKSHAVLSTYFLYTDVMSGTIMLHIKIYNDMDLYYYIWDM